MNTENIDFNIEALKARITVLEDFIKAKHPDFPTTPKGTSGTMTGDEHSHGDEIEGWVTPKTSYGANIREWASTASDNPPLYWMELGQSRSVTGYAADAEGKINPATGKAFVWYHLDDDNFVREDVVTFTPDKPAPVSPINAALWPAPVTNYTITTRHGDHGHKGIDLAAPMGTSIINPADGFVTRAFDCVDCKPDGDGPSSINVDHLGDGYGSLAIVRYIRESLPASAQSHPDIRRYVFVLYGHMSDIDANQGFPIRKGSRIGRVGSTGNSTGPHLHFEIRTSDDPNIGFYDAPLINPTLLVKV